MTDFEKIDEMLALLQSLEQKYSARDILYLFNLLEKLKQELVSI